MNLRWYQNEAVEATIDYLCNESGYPLICLPTGSGKSVVIAELARRAVVDFGGRVMVLQHRKELIEQNAAKVRSLLPGVSVGVYSAGLGLRDQSSDVVCAGIQSVYKNAKDFAPRNLIICDECHLIPNDGEGMYRTFLSNLEKSQTEGFRVVGLTATPFRTGEGNIYGNDKFFSRMVYNADIIRLIDEWFLCDVASSVAKSSVDTSKLHKRAGEFIAEEVETLFGNDVTVAAVNEIVSATLDRNAIMIFATSIRHAEYIENLLHLHADVHPESVGSIYGSTSELERAATIENFKNGRIKFLVNVDVLTTGFDAPVIDAIAILRATASPGLYAQMVGRGLRTHSLKQNCIVLDFGENIKRHGSIDRIRAKRQAVAAREKAESEAKEKNIETKTCPACDVLNVKTAKRCECGFLFPFDGRHNAEHETTLAVIGKTENVVFDVVEIEYQKWSKPPKPDSMRVDYHVSKDGKQSLLPISEWVCFDHIGYARKKATEWWLKRSRVPVPVFTEDAVTLATLGGVAEPRKIQASFDGKYWSVVDVLIESELPIDYKSELEEAPF
jgi:DNA repair protein RadD